MPAMPTARCTRWKKCWPLKGPVVSVHFTSYAGVVSLDASPETLLSDLAERAGLRLNLRCGGKGSCRRCRVFLEEGSFEIGRESLDISAGDADVEALACQTRVLSNEARVRIPLLSLVEEEGQIDDDFVLFFTPDGRASRDGLGAAVDIGTTTVVAALVNLKDGRIVRKASRYNAQIEKADDVASRISFCETPEGLEALRALCIERTLMPLLADLCSDSHTCLPDIRHIVLSGNTVMLHLALGLSPVSIGRIPFEPLKKVFERQSAPDLGLNDVPNAVVDCVPCAAGYIGGDIVSDCLVGGLTAQPGANLLIDIGTNGEMVLAEGGRLTACATAAGPAFEGAGLRHGCRAADGAIEHLQFGEDLEMEARVIGAQKPMGLCGSAIIDFLACGRQCGLISLMGRYDIERLKAAGRYVALEENGNRSHACIVVPEGDSGIDEAVTVSEADIAQVIKAKAAIFAGALTLLEQHERTVSELDHIFLAGGFARHIDIRHAVEIGLLPDAPVNKFLCMGNGSLAGAYLALRDERFMRQMEALSTIPRIVTLNTVPTFESHFIDALALPNVDPDVFPSVHFA